MCPPAVPQPTFRSVISYLWTKLRIVCLSFMNSTLDQRQLGFMYNQKYGIVPRNEYHKLPIYSVFEGFLASGYPRSAVVSEIHWRKCRPTKSNKALHEFLVLYLTEMAQNKQKETETETNTEKGKGKRKGKEKESRNQNQLERSVIVVERRPQPSRRQNQVETPPEGMGMNRNGNGSNVSINSSRDSLQTSSTSYTAEDMITFSGTGSDLFVKSIEPEHQTLKGFKVKDGTNQDDMLHFTQVLTASYAVSQAKPAYTLPRHNCYYFAWQTYKILEELIIKKGTYEALTIKSPKYEAGQSITSIVEGYNESLYKGDAPAVRAEYTEALKRVNASVEAMKLQGERIQALEAEAEAWKERGLFLEEALRRAGIDPTTLTPPPQSISLT